MHYFISAGEPSGDLHGENLIRSIRRLDPDARFSGFGGDRMTGAGCKLLYPLCNLSVMWFLRVLLNIFTFVRLKREAGEFFRREKPDAVILIDYPGFHWHIAQKAKEAGVPVFYFVPPQLWAWAGWRIKKMRRNVDCVLSALPFEHRWYAERKVNSRFIGHPYFDELAEKVVDSELIEKLRMQPKRLIALLPGSRMQEVTRNFPDMLDSAENVIRQNPDVRFAVASYNAAQADVARNQIASRKLPVEIYVGKTSEIIQAAEMCLMVSGSVSLEVMYRLKPAVVVYRVGKLFKFIGSFFIQVKFMTLVNLLARDAVYPEFPCTENESAAMADILNRWLADSSAREEVIARLAGIKREVAVPGACDRAAHCIREFLIENRMVARKRAA